MTKNSSPQRNSLMDIWILQASSMRVSRLVSQIRRLRWSGSDQIMSCPASSNRRSRRGIYFKPSEASSCALLSSDKRLSYDRGPRSLKLMVKNFQRSQLVASSYMVSYNFQVSNSIHRILCSLLLGPFDEQISHSSSTVLWTSVSSCWLPLLLQFWHLCIPRLHLIKY